MNKTIKWKRWAAFAVCAMLLAALCAGFVCISAQAATDTPAFSEAKPGDGRLTWPVPISVGISSRYYRDSGAFHGALDFACAIGTPVYATAGGEVVLSKDTGCQGSHNAGYEPRCGLSSCKGAYGNWIIIKHNINGITIWSLYGHLKTGSLLVKNGDEVLQGQQIALSGAAGNTQGAHLHFELCKKNAPKNTENRYDPLKSLTRIKPDPDSTPPVIKEFGADKKTSKDFQIVLKAKDPETGISSVTFTVQHTSKEVECFKNTYTAVKTATAKDGTTEWRLPEDKLVKIRDLGNLAGSYIITASVKNGALMETSKTEKVTVKEPVGSKYTVQYYQEGGSSKHSATTTSVTFDRNKSTAKIESLTDINKAGFAFKGWHVWRDYDDTWYMKNTQTNKKYWLPMTDGKEPAGFVRCVYPSGIEVSRTAPSGNVRFYGIWVPKTIKIQYDSGKIISVKTQKPTFGDGTTVLSADALGSDFKKTGYTLTGWRVQKDGLWLVRNTSTNKLSWRSKDGSGYTYYKLGLSSKVDTVIKASENNKTITLVAAWKANTFTIEYYANSKGNSTGGALIKGTQSCVYGRSNKTKTINQLGISVPAGYSGFDGWVVVRSDGKYRVKNSAGKGAWVSLVNGSVPSGYKLWLYSNGCSVSTTVPSGSVKLYARFKPNGYFVDVMNNNKRVTGYACNYGQRYQLKTISQMGISTPTGYTFAGWKLRRYDGAYRLRNTSTDKNEWKQLSNGTLPSGYKYVYYKDGASYSSLTTENNKTVKFIATWKPIKFTIQYGKITSSGPVRVGSTTTTVTYNTSKQIPSFSSLGLKSPGSDYEGRWRIHRLDTDQWLCIDMKTSKRVWLTKAQHDSDSSRYIYMYYRQNCKVKTTVSKAITLEFDVYWKTKSYWKSFDNKYESYRQKALG